MYKKLLEQIRGFDLEAVKPDIMLDNRKFVIIWSLIETLFWVYCLIMTQFDDLYFMCKTIYLVAFIASLIILGISIYTPSKCYRATWFYALGVELILLVASIFIARNLAPKTIMVFVSVILVPVMFISETRSVLLLLIGNILLFALLGRGKLDGETYAWVLSNILIFSLIGILLGHFVNRARFERYIFAHSAVELAELQTKYAYYDQLTGFKNRRAYSEKVQDLGKEISWDCCVIMLDVNGLKQTNDTLGHDVGDELLIGASDCIRKSFADIGDIYRIGGDEFCVILNGTEETIKDYIGKLDTCSRDWKSGKIENISIAHGYTQVRKFEDIESAIKVADERMYENKREYYKNKEKVDKGSTL